jgi:hypothetical protein
MPCWNTSRNWDPAARPASSSYQESADKFRECADFAKWPGAKCAAIIEAVQSLEKAPDMGRLTAALTA